MNNSGDRKQELVAFLPCRAGSQRVPLKNTRQFDPDGRSLFDIKLAQLINCPDIDRIVVSTNDEAIKSATRAAISGSERRIQLDHRPDTLCSSSTSTDEVVRYAATIIRKGHILWTHVTSPFVDTDDYSDIIQRYFAARAAGKHRSLMTVTKLQGFIWNDTGPINYDRAIEKWPRTQTLAPLYEVNSAAFITEAAAMARIGDRITDDVLMYPLSKSKAVDIDDMDEFHLAMALFARQAPLRGSSGPA